MKMKMNVLAAAVALASVAGMNQAQAAIQDGSNGNGQLFLTVWDSVANVQYVRNLNVNINDFLPSSVAPRAGDNPTQGTMTPEAGMNMSFAGDALFTSTFAGSSAANLQWTITAADSTTAATGNTTVGYNRELFTTSLAQGTFTFSNGTVNTGTGNINTFLANANGNLGCATANSCAGAGPSPFATASPGVSTVTTSGTGYGDLGFYYVSRTDSNNLHASQEVKFANSANLAKWTLAADGSVVYSLAPAVAAVPIPAAAWLFGSGLVGLVGVARRRNKA